MTREERALKNLKQMCSDGRYLGSGSYVPLEVLEDFEVAIKALEQEPRWIPVSEKLPTDRDWYLGIFKEPDTGWINPLPFICDYVGCETKAATKEYWILRGFTDIDEPCDYYVNLECVAWQPLPQPFESQEREDKE